MNKTNTDIEIINNYEDYNDYIEYQKEKTEDKERQKKWLNEEWELKINIFKLLFLDIFRRLYDINKRKIKMERSLCLGSRTGQEVKALIDLDDIDLHYAASVVKSKLKYDKILCDKGSRYFGDTKLKFNKHLLHGLVSLSLFSEIIAVNIFFTSIVCMFVITLTASLIFIMKILLNIALLGWTSIILISLFILFIIFFLLSMFSLIILLNKNNYSGGNKTLNKELISSIKTFE